MARYHGVWTMTVIFRMNKVFVSLSMASYGDNAIVISE